METDKLPDDQKIELISKIADGGGIDWIDSVKETYKVPSDYLAWIKNDVAVDTVKIDFIKRVIRGDFIALAAERLTACHF